VDGDWVPIGALEDLPDGPPTRIDLDGLDLLVLRRGDEVLVASNRCTHQGAPLHRGAAHPGGSLPTITCPLHGSTFSLADGRVLRGPATTPLPSYQSRVTGNIVEIRDRG
jgi:nitrite reductase/ring-hydroxylating ferredoxin subunit